MKQTPLLALFLTLLLTLVAPGAAIGRDQHREPNVNARYDVESVSISGVPESRMSQGLRDDMQKLVGGKYDPEAANALAERMRKELAGYHVSIKVRRGERAEHVSVTFEARPFRTLRIYAFDVRMAPLVYYSHDGFSGALTPGFEGHHNYFSIALLSNADELLERNTGVRLRYQHRRVGTKAVQIGIEYERYHQSFQPEIRDALPVAPELPGIYRTRRTFAPSVSVLPVRQLKLTFGTSLQNLAFIEPIQQDRRANAFIVGAQLREEVESGAGFRHTIAVDYGLRAATSSLQSDFVYNRHLITADYTLSEGRHVFGAHVKAGHINAAAPLFERFSLGNSATLRGWDKFDVAALGGARLAYGSLEYRYRPFQIFYDFGSVWDPGQPATVRHSVGFGLTWKNGFFVSLGFPVRLDDVRPAVMFGFSGLGR